MEQPIGELDFSIYILADTLLIECIRYDNYYETIIQNDAPLDKIWLWPHRNVNYLRAQLVLCSPWWTSEEFSWISC